MSSRSQRIHDHPAGTGGLRLHLDHGGGGRALLVEADRGAAGGAAEGPAGAVRVPALPGRNRRRHVVPSGQGLDHVALDRPPPLLLHRAVRRDLGEQ
jgi:hypothetical protein